MEEFKDNILDTNRKKNVNLTLEDFLYKIKKESN